MFDKPDAQRLDYAAYNHADPLDGQQYEPDLPKDTPEDFCLDHLCNAREQMVEQIGKLSRGAAAMSAVMSYLQSIVRECVKAGMAEWMQQENDPSTFKGDEAVIKLLDVVMGTMIGQGGMVRISARQVKFRAEVILFILQKTPKTLTQIAAEHGYTKANASAIAKQYQRKYDLRKTRGMKSDAAVEVYRERAKRVHKERKEKEQQCKTNTQTHSFNKFWTSTSRH
jgi:hypothetical protein